MVIAFGGDGGGVGGGLVVVSWKGDPQANAPIGRKASTNVNACFEIDSKARDPGFESLNFLSV